MTNTVATSITVVSTFEPKQERLPLIAFPNPANQAVTLKLPSGASEGGRLEIFSVAGKLVYAGAALGNLETIDLQSIAAGAYWCRWVSGNTAYWAKIVVSH